MCLLRDFFTQTCIHVYLENLEKTNEKLKSQVNEVPYSTLTIFPAADGEVLMRYKALLDIENCGTRRRYVNR